MADVHDRQHRLHLKLDEVLGEENAATLMSGFDSTSSDLALGRADLELLRADLKAELHREINGLQRNLFFGMLTSQAAFAGLVIAFVG